MIDRRSFLQLALAAQAFAALPARAGTPGLHMGEPQPFSHDWLKAHAQALAAADYTPPPRPDPKIVSSIDYDAHGQLHYRSDYALFGDGDQSAFPITFQHVGMYFPKTVRMYAVEQGRGQEVATGNPLRPGLFHHSARKPRGAIAPKPIAHGGLLGPGAQRQH